MRFYEYGSKSCPVMVMLTGSFCPAKALEYLYIPLSERFHIILPEYNGHYAGSRPFTTRKHEATLIVKYLRRKKISTVNMLYGQSMGSEIGIELMRQLIECGIKVEHAVFDGAPLIKLSVPYKMFMYFKFRTLTKLMKGRDVEEVINYRFLNKFTNGDTASLRPLIEALVTIAPYLTDETVRNETECCYTFDFPKFSTSVQKRMRFLYGSGEKAYKTCHKLVKKAYPHAKMTVFRDYGHMTYSVRNTEKYVKMLISISG